MRIENVIRNPRGLNGRNTEVSPSLWDWQKFDYSIFRFKMRAKFTVADESSRKFSVHYESVVSVAIRCIFMRFSERFRVTLVAVSSLLYLCTGCPKKSGVLVWKFNF